jgi:3-hydroxyisobutyrate dehydrogenase
MQKNNIGWIGTGIMGAAMVSHLIESGCSLNIYSRTKEKALPLLAKGAAWYESVGELGKAADIIFLMVGYPNEVEQVVNELLTTLQRGSVIIDMATSSPSLERELYALCAKHGIGYLDAPVSGGDIGAKNAALSIMVGGDKQHYEKILPYFELMGKTIVYHGESGSGQHAKMVNQTLIAGTMIGMCEAMIYTSRAGLDIENVLTSVQLGAAGSWSLSNLAPRIVWNDFKPGFMIEHFLKDLKITLEECEKMNIMLPGINLAKQLYASAVANGYGKKGTHALYLSMNDTQLTE